MTNQYMVKLGSLSDLKTLLNHAKISEGTPSKEKDEFPCYALVIPKFNYVGLRPSSDINEQLRGMITVYDNISDLTYNKLDKYLRK